jgi:transposase
MARPFFISRPISRTYIRRQLHQTVNPRLRERLQALLWFATGSDCTAIADKIGRCRQIVSQYLRTYDRFGFKKLGIVGRGPGRRSQLSDKQKQTLLKLIGIPPREMGYPFNNWDCKRLATYVDREMHVALSSEQIRRTLYKLGCRLLRPRHKLLQADPIQALKKNGRYAGLWASPARIAELSSSLKMR